MNHYYIGIDVSKIRLDVDYCGHARSYDNASAGVAQLIADLQLLQKNGQLALVVCEATGGYEQKIVRACHAASLPIHVAHANSVRYFAKSKGIMAKTDKLDAVVLSDYGRLLRPAPDILLLSEEREKMRELVKRREQLQADKYREQNRLDKITSRDISDSIKAHIGWLDQQLKELEKKLALLEKTDTLNPDHRLLTSIPAIGKIAAYYLLTYLPELGKISPKALAALVGVAPYNRESGNSRGKRFIQGGRTALRQVLYMSAVTAIRCNADLKAFYQRLRAKGKVAKVALIAVIRKLISMANSVLRRKTRWQEIYSRG